MAIALNTSTAPSSLAPDVLRRRLRDLAGDERNAQVEFLLHLSEFDSRKGFLDAGYDSLWRYCLQELHLREGPAARRIAAMRVLRQHSGLEAPLRDGRLCLSTVTLISPLLGDMSLAEVIARAAYRTKDEVEHLVASLRPRVAPRVGVRQLAPMRRLGGQPVAQPEPHPHPNPQEQPHTPVLAPVAMSAFVPSASSTEPPAAVSNGSSSQAPSAAAPTRPQLSPVSAEQWSLRVTMDASMKADLETLKSLLSHTSGGDLTEVLREALRCAVEKHGKRRGAVAPKHERKPRAEAASKDAASRAESKTRSSPRSIPASVRREVWARDQGCCAWRSKDGRRCGGRWKLELDHIKPVALGGTPTADNLRLLCRSHNLLHAEQVFGSACMRAFSARAPILGSADRLHRDARWPSESSSRGAESLATSS